MAYIVLKNIWEDRYKTIKFCKGQGATGHIQKQSCCKGFYINRRYCSCPQLSKYTWIALLRSGSKLLLKWQLDDWLYDFPERLKQWKLQFSVYTSPLFAVLICYYLLFILNLIQPFPTADWKLCKDWVSLSLKGGQLWWTSKQGKLDATLCQLVVNEK